MPEYNSKNSTKSGYGKMRVVSVSDNNSVVVREACINNKSYLIFNGSSTVVLENKESSTCDKQSN